jgi:proline dehydrogenase
MSIMLRTLLIYLSKASWARSIVTHWKFAWRAASRFVAGEKLEDAIRVVKALNAKGINATLDHLGEHTTSIEKAKQATEDILAIFDAIQESRVRSNVSIKLTQIGLAVDEEICEENLMRIAQKAKEYNTFLRIDMEDATVVDKTLALFRKARQTCGCENVGQAIQAYLYRSQADIEGLMKEQARIRLCKGAYKEPEDVAYPKKADVDASFDRLTVALVDGALAAGMPAISEDGRVPPIPAIATHDEKRIVFAKQCANERKLPKNAFEFQMLNGIAEGYPVRVYVPYGTEWYPYFVRRLAERPANIWFFLSNFFRK